MIYLVLADLVLFLHFSFILFVTLGVVLLFRWPPLVWLHAPCVLWGVWIEVGRGICPLTPLENRFRRMGGAAGYTEGFIDHYLGSLIYPSGLTPTVQTVLGIALGLFNAGAYLAWIWVRRRACMPGGETAGP